ncbi:MAG: VacJ family lipoprotein [Nitrospira sp.]|nr:VacJ family lipoprotein [Nitrospira sp.]MDH4369663.1 VacJ family lipoprotein [Nitrospira sp.]MDH5496863.1 VacJ family lipoprotein [Nitrospira sp.]MDH5725779.1 VacJ family lipoprotein [Nitrospira sp.]
MMTTAGCRPACFGQREYGFVLVVILIVLSGCAAQKAATSPLTPNIGQNPQPVLLADADPRTISSAAPGHDASSEEPFDPFSKPGEEGVEEYDPWEPLNTKVFEFNRQLDRWLLKPAAKGYNFIVPNIVQVGISNFFYNIRVTPRFMNNLFQGKFKGAGIEAGRFLINTTAGVGGFFDVAQHFHLTTPEEDTGQTLGFYGVKPGPYIMVPFLGPYTARDLVGYVGDFALNPVYWLMFPVIEIDAIPSVIPHANRTTSSLILLTARGTEIVNDRSLNLEKFQGVEESTLDLYAAVRNAYLQKRAKAIRE